ncbi:MAG TPA: Sua5/YciO/YrdC/YwlC family protein [Luteimonas sp.]|nr:Sua5/YciO/YrdC/YwlC family protein [Luteimonas sp.]
MRDCDDIDRAAAVLRRGDLLAYPTEGVWGLGCDPFSEAAVTRLLALKQRTPDKGLILVAATLTQFDGLLDWAALDASRREAVQASWPGPNTWLVPATARVPPWVRGAHETVAVRVSAHPVVVALCRAWDGPLVSTSANRAGDPAPATRAALAPAIVDGVDLVVAGETSGLGQPSTLRDAATGARIR